MENNTFDEGVRNNSNPITGVIGAVIGAAIGVAIWVVIYKLGYIAAIGGIAIMVGALKGYELFGKTLDVTGIVISVIISIIMVFVANYLSWTVEWYDVLNESETWKFSEVLGSLFELNEYAGLTGDFVKDLIIGYVLSIIGAASTVTKKLNEVK